jgi:hypothetical protein
MVFHRHSSKHHLGCCPSYLILSYMQDLSYMQFWKSQRYDVFVEEKKKKIETQISAPAHQLQ